MKASQILGFLLSLLLAAGAMAQSAFTPFTISDIRVDGLQRISEGTVFTYLPLEVGDRLTPVQASRAMRSLFDTGFFADIQLARQAGDILVIQVEERPAIARIDIDGNRDIETEDLERGLAGVGLAEGETYNPLVLEKIQQELTRQYFSRGKYNVSIDAQADVLSRNRVQVDIDISEGKAAKIKHINIVGNETFTDDEIIDTFELSTGNWLSWYTQSDRYEREKLSGDLETLRSFYQDRGYLDYETESVQVAISEDKRDIYVTANIREGEIFTVSEIAFAGDLIFEEEFLRRLQLVKPGDTFSRNLVEATADGVTGLLTNIGYAFANVNPIPELDRENNTAKLTYLITPGQRVYVRRIEFRGNTRTRDEVLRREMRQFEGGWFSQASLDRSKVRLERLGYVNNVTFETPEVPGASDQVDVIVSVEEESTGNVSFGFGYSRVQSIVASIALSQDNFLGTGNRFSLSVNNSRVYRVVDIGYLNPYWTDSGISRGFNFSYRTIDRGDANIAAFNTSTLAGSVNFGIPITETDRINFRLGADRTEINPQLDVLPLVDNDGDGVVTEEELEPEAFRAQIGWARDSRNRFFNPTRGSTQRLGIEVALPGSTFEYYKIDAGYSKYWPLTSKLTLNTRIEIGYGDGYGGTRRLPAYENYYAGGPNSVRGYEDNTLGPQLETGDETNPRLRPIGGALRTLAGFELLYPLPIGGGPSTRLSWFVDVGQVYEDFDAFDAGDLRYATGIGLNWQAPVGPIQLSLAVPFNEGELDETETLQFTFGTTFR